MQKAGATGKRTDGAAALLWLCCSACRDRERLPGSAQSSARWHGRAARSEWEGREERPWALKLSSGADLAGPASEHLDKIYACERQPSARLMKGYVTVKHAELQGCAPSSRRPRRAPADSCRNLHPGDGTTSPGPAGAPPPQPPGSPPAGPSGPAPAALRTAPHRTAAGRACCARRPAGGAAVPRGGRRALREPSPPGGRPLRIVRPRRCRRRERGRARGRAGPGRASLVRARRRRPGTAERGPSAPLSRAQGGERRAEPSGAERSCARPRGSSAGAGRREERGREGAARGRGGWGGARCPRSRGWRGSGGARSRGSRPAPGGRHLPGAGRGAEPARSYGAGGDESASTRRRTRYLRARGGRGRGAARARSGGSCRAAGGGRGPAVGQVPAGGCFRGRERPVSASHPARWYGSRSALRAHWWCEASVVRSVLLGKRNREHEGVRDELGPFSKYSVLTPSFYKLLGSY